MRDRRSMISARCALLMAMLNLALIACGASRLKSAGDQWGTLEFDKRNRTYLLHLPPTIRSGKPLPLVVNLHGGGGNARSAAEQTGFNLEADRQGFIVVYPNGTSEPHPLLEALGLDEPYTWNAGTCCGYAKEQNVDDVGFIRALIAKLEREYPIDRKRIYATGISNGGMMAYRLACEMSDTFAAIGVVAGVQTIAPCHPSQPVPVIHLHGTADENVPLQGGIGRKAFDKAPKPPVMETINFWVAHDGCSTQPQVTRSGSVTKFAYPCAGGIAVEFYLIEGGGHAWPGGKRMLSILDEPTREVSATPLILQFFAAHARH